MPRKAKRVPTLLVRITRLADALEREGKRLDDFLQTIPREDNENPTGVNRAWVRLRGQTEALDAAVETLHTEMELRQTDDYYAAFLSQFYVDLKARQHDLDIYLNDNADTADERIKWEVEAHSIKLGHVMKQVQEVLQAHKEERA